MSTPAYSVFHDPLDFRVFVLVIFLGMVLGVAYDALAGGKLVFFRQERSWRLTMYGGHSKSPYPRSSVVAKSVVRDVAGAGPLLGCGSTYSRWASHILMEWGFLITVVYTAVRFFAYPEFAPFTLGSPAQAALTAGYAMMVVGCAMFLFQRVNVSKERRGVLTYSSGDRFAAGVFAYSIAGLIYEFVYAASASPTAFLYFWLAVYIAATAYLFLTVPWTKFSHMFYKAVYNVQRRLDEQTGLVHTPPPSEKVYVKEGS